MTNLQKITEACYKSNPKLIRSYTSITDGTEKEIRYYPSQLSDVLIAINENKSHNIDGVFIRDDGTFSVKHSITIIPMPIKWQLDKPLSEQSEETINFIAELLL